MDKKDKLSADDIKKLMEQPSAAAQTEVMSKLVAHYNAGGSEALTPAQNAQADDIFRVLLNRAEVQVRAMLATTLKQSDKLPPEIALQMANDVQEVALPIIEFSQALSDEDLLKIVGNAQEQEKLIAIAKRNTVSETVSEALVEKRIEKVTATLVKNEGADIAEKTFDKIVDFHGESAEVLGSMLERGGVPVVVVEKLVDRVSGNLREALEKKYGNLVELKELRKTLSKSMEMTRLKLIGMKANDSQLTRLIKYLDENDQLPPFSALSMANLELFEVSLARILRIPFSNVHTLLQDPNGLKAVYERAKLPEEMYEGVALTVGAILALHKEAEDSGVIGTVYAVPA